MKDVTGASILMRKITRRKKTVWRPVVPIERLFDTVSLHHAHSVGYRGEKKLWNFVSGTGWVCHCWPVRSRCLAARAHVLAFARARRLF